MKHWLCALVVMYAGTAQAVDLQLPAGARQMIVRDTVQDRYFAPIAPFLEGDLPTLMLEGAVARSAWRVDVAGLTPLQLISPLRDQLLAAGFRIVLDCAALDCGGYDFRFATEVLPAPNMYVNIRNYHVITAQRGALGAPEVVTILTSASSGGSFVQIIQVGGDAAENKIDAVSGRTSTLSEGDIDETLLRDGHVVLAGLDFQSGTSELGAGPFSALADLAQVLKSQPEMRVALVGHTDNVGELDGNMLLSRDRANAVRARLIEQYGVASSRLDSQGMGYLAPFTSNLTEAGRETNRRVEAVVLGN
ncbi:MAG: OmpA family protein [Sulfitobacter sp.]|jgi:outer membrane protein OmpA-like peptidoglycan-associated protein